MDSSMLHINTGNSSTAPLENTSKRRLSGNTGSRGQQRRILIDRDYSEPFTIRFCATFPAALDGRLDKESFEYTITQINSMFERAEKYNWKTCSQTLLGYITVGFIYNCWDSKYERCIKEVTKFVEEQNNRIYNSLGLCIKDPALKAYRNMEIVING